MLATITTAKRDAYTSSQFYIYYIDTLLCMYICHMYGEQNLSQHLEADVLHSGRV